MTASRRTFFIQSLSSVVTLSALSVTHPAQAQAMVSDADPQAVALGYKTDSSKTDTQKYPQYAAGQACSGCVLFQGKATDSAGSCAVFGNRMVASKGWCSAWAKKA